MRRWDSSTHPRLVRIPAKEPEDTSVKFDEIKKLLEQLDYDGEEYIILVDPRPRFYFTKIQPTDELLPCLRIVCISDVTPWYTKMSVEWKPYKLSELREFKKKVHKKWLDSKKKNRDSKKSERKIRKAS